VGMIPVTDARLVRSRLTSNTTARISMHDLGIHGSTEYGLFDTIGGLITMTRTRIAYNGFVGWMFDDGVDTPTRQVRPSTPATLRWSRSAATKNIHRGHIPGHILRTTAAKHL
jgi:hypothetical protein